MTKVLRYFRPKLQSIAFCSLAALQAPVVMAQQANSSSNAGSGAQGGLEEIVVTATKQGEERLIDVPMAIQAFSGEELAERGVKSSTDLMQLIPGASQLSLVGESYRTYSFRGSGAGGSVGDSMVGYYIDDTPYGVPNFQSAPPISYFDLDRVEVLRGPQGTLYGQGSMGGTIIFHTKDPSLTHFTAQALATVSETADAGQPNRGVSGGVSIPLLNNQLGLRISGGYEYKAGYADVYDGPASGPRLKKDANDIRNTDARAVLLWQPTDALRVRVQAWHFTIAQDYLQVMASLDPPQQLNQGGFKGYASASVDYFSSSISYNFGSVALTNATSYQYNSPGGFGTGLGLGPPLGNGILTNSTTAYSFVNETRLSSTGSGPFHWVGGLFYQHATSPYSQYIAFPAFFSIGSTTTRTENESIFGEVSYDLFGGKLVPLAGIRYYRDDREDDSTSFSNSTPLTTIHGKETPRVTTWRVNLAYHPVDRMTLFATAGTGFRSGILQAQTQANAVSADGIPGTTTLKPDKLTNIEVGAKTSLLDNTLDVSSSVYRIHYVDYQSGLQTSVGLTAFANFGEAYSQGLDLDLYWKTPIEGLSIAFVGNVNHSYFGPVNTGFTVDSPEVREGNRLVSTPAFNWRTDFNYTRNVGTSGWAVITRASAAQTGGLNQADGERFRTWALFGASVGARKGPYEATLYAENLGDYRGPVVSNGPTLLAGPYPRTIGLRLQVNFD